MAQRSAAGYIANIEAQFPTSGTGTITAARVRTHIGNDTADSFLNKTDGGEITGNVGIGVSPNAPLQFENVTNRRKIVLYESANNDYQIFGFGVDAPSDLMQYTIGANIGAHVFYAAASSSAATELMRITGGGDLTLLDTGTGVDWVATSDERLKENIKKIDYDVLEKILKIGAIVCEYDRKDNGKHETGFIAQELLKVAPEYVINSDDPEKMMAVNYAKMTALLFKGFQQLLER